MTQPEKENLDPYVTTTIYPDGTVISCAHEGEPDLEFLQDEVGGWIELLPDFTKLNTHVGEAYANEEGLLLNLTVNIAASREYMMNINRIACLRGPVVFVRKGTL